jgi:hypothetical protein
LGDAEETRYFSIATYPFPSYVADNIEAITKSRLKSANDTFSRIAIIVNQSAALLLHHAFQELKQVSAGKLIL